MNGTQACVAPVAVAQPTTATLVTPLRQSKAAAAAAAQALATYAAAPLSTPPKLGAFKPYPILACGNEPDLPTLPSFASEFALIGTGCLQNLELIKKLCGDMPGKQITLNFRPKLFIIDFCLHVEIFWSVIRNTFISSPDLKTFISDLEQHAKILQRCAEETGNTNPRNVAADIKELMLKLCEVSEGNSELKCTISKKNQQIYAFMRDVVIGSTFIDHDWTERQAFDYVNSVLPASMPRVVYASNIAEYLASAPNGTARILRMIDNINLVNANLTLYTRTTQEYYSQNKRLRPDAYVIFDKPTSAVAQLFVLNNVEYAAVAERKLSTSELKDHEFLNRMTPEQQLERRNVEMSRIYFIGMAAAQAADCGHGKTANRKRLG